jgi:putative hydrolase of the HAD superfamily
MVGDAPAPDIGGGRAVGLRTIWLHRSRTWNPLDGDPPDVTVSSLVAAVQVVLSESVGGSERRPTERERTRLRSVD